MKKVFQRLSFAVLLACSLILAATSSVLAQDLDDVTISGRVTDANGASVVGASVTAVQTETNLERTATTDDEGRYRIVDLPPGTYNVKISAPNFAVQEQNGFVTVAGQNLQINPTLAPAGVTAEQTITIDDEGPVVDTTRTVVGGTITQREVEELPNVTRNPLDLVLTLGGTSEEALSTRDLAEDRDANPRSTPAEQGNFSLSGGASYSNNITIDGLDNNDDRSARDRFQPSLEAVAEVQVITNQFSAEYGRASGGRINLRTRSGSNRFRGRAFMFYRDDQLNANTYYNNLTFYNADGAITRNPLPRLPFTEYNPGFTFSGPVILPFGEGSSIYNGRDRTFFAVAYEYNNLRDTALIDTYVPVGANPRFALPLSTGGTPTCDNANAAACTGSNPTAALVAPYNFTYPTPNLNHTFTARIDHKLSESNNMTFGWQLGRRSNLRQRSGTLTRLVDTIQARNSNSDALNFTDNHVFSDNLVNQFRMQWSRFAPSYQAENPDDPVILITYRDPVAESTRTLIAGNSTSSTLQNFSDSRIETRWQFQDSLTYTAGAHIFKGGFDIQRVDSKARSLEDATGTFNFGSVLNYQNNVLSRYRQNFGTASDVKNTYWGVFLNDEMRLLSNLTLSYGLRYERETAVEDNNNFGPRLGVAWDPFENGKTVVRFGAGIFYNRVLLRTVGDFIQNQAGGLIQFDTNVIGTSGADVRRSRILAAIAQQFPSGFSSVEDLRNLVAATNCSTTATPAACSPSVGFLANAGNTSNPLRTIDPNLKIPESYQFNVGFEREIGNGFAFEANYTWNKTVHLWREYNPNAPVLPAGYEDFTAYLLANPYTFRNNNGTVRTYRFYLGSTTDSSGVATTQNGTTGCSTTANVTCFVNLNSINTSSTLPASATIDNNNSVGSPIGIALAAIAPLRPDQTVQEKQTVASIGNALYHGLILELRSRFRRIGYGFGSSFRAVYTLSSTRDDGLNNTSNAEINGDFVREWARSLQDRRHRFALSGTFDTPSWLGELRFSPLLRLGSSAPFNISIAQDRNLNDVGGDRVIFTGDLDDIRWRDPDSPFPTELASQFLLQPIGSRSGNLPRNAGRGPGLFVFDLSVSREFKFGERFRLRPTVEFGNILNAVVFSYGSEFINFVSLSGSPTLTQRTNYQNFLIPTRSYRPREIKLGVRFDF